MSQSQNEIYEINTDLNMESEQNHFPEDDVQEEHACCCSGGCSDEVEEESCCSENDAAPTPAPSKTKDHSVKEHFDKFVKELETIQDFETKLQKTLDFMEAAISQSGSPQFKNFWDARLVALQLFKENVNPTVRSLLWTRYSDLSKEARRLKEILDEQSSFAAEQIEIAIKALEAEITALAEGHFSPVALEQVRTMREKLSAYELVQGELAMLNAQAARVNALRKELIKTDMRIRIKNKFFQRLSAAGDMIFPRRKELIKEISNQFIQDIEHFVTQDFETHKNQESVFVLREEIKSLQNLAKQLTLNTHSFTHTRQKLSECWDALRGIEKERKKERAQMKVVYKDNAEGVLGQVNAFNTSFAAGEISTLEGLKKLDEISKEMRNVELGREEVVQLREEIQKSRQVIQEKLKEEEQARLSIEQEKERQKREAFNSLKNELDQLIQSINASTVEHLLEQKDLIQQKIASSSFSRIEKQELERKFRPLKDGITEKKEREMLDLSEDDRQALDKMKGLLHERKERRKEMKTQIDQLRKALSTSGMDFTQSLSANAQLNEEKERLDKLNVGIKELETKIALLEKAS
jgi:hypothetical protein